MSGQKAHDRVHALMKLLKVLQRNVCKCKFQITNFKSALSGLVGALFALHELPTYTLV